MTRLDPMARITLLVGLALTAAAFVGLGTRFGIGTAAGALFAFANVVAFDWLVGRILERRSGGALLAIKLVVTFAVVYVLCRVLGLEPRGVALGYGSMVVGSLLGARHSAIPTTRSGEA